MTTPFAIGVLFACCLVTDASIQRSETNNSDAFSIILDELSSLREQGVQQKTWMMTQETINQHLAAQIQVHEQVNKRLTMESDNQKDRVQQLESTIDKQDEVIQHLKDAIRKQESDISLLKTHCAAQEAKEEGLQSIEPMPEVRDHHQALGCTGDHIQLACSNGGLITVTRAYYGQYRQTTPCNIGCCAPHPGLDCSETVQENNPTEWINLKTSCDNITQCSYLYNGSYINDCETGYDADYMLIYYSFDPYNLSDYVAFSAYAAFDRYYEHDDIVLFDYELTNIGNHYNSATSNFVCPYDGIYSFSISFYSGQNGYMFVDIMQNNERIISGFADYEQEHHLVTHAMSTIVTECQVGDVVWALCSAAFEPFMQGGVGTSSHFTGFLLHNS